MIPLYFEQRLHSTENFFKGDTMVALPDIKKKAKEMGIAGTKMKKDDLILAIQKAEGNFPCFKSATSMCDQWTCLWRDECLSKN